MRKIHWTIAGLAALWLALALFFADTAGANEPWVVKVVSVQGHVEARKTGTTHWLPVKLDDRFRPGDMIRLHQAANKLRNGLYKLEQRQEVSPEVYDAIRMGNKIADAVEADVDTMSAKLGQARQMPVLPGANPNMGRGYEAAWAEFEKTRGDYRAFAEAREQLRATAFAQAFGKVPRNAEEQWDAQLRKEPSEQIKPLNILREHSPETIVDLKRWKIRQVANNMFDFTEAGGKSPVSVDKFINELTEANRRVGAGFWSPREKEALRGAIAYARMIENKAAHEPGGFARTSAFARSGSANETSESAAARPITPIPLRKSDAIIIETLLMSGCGCMPFKFSSFRARNILVSKTPDTEHGNCHAMYPHNRYRELVNNPS